jgi:single-strand DNA-binding protein
MSDLNQCSFIGRLGKDVELRVTPAGDSIANFSIACDWKTKKSEGVEWVNISVFGKLAELCGQYIGKGSQVFVQGRMKTDKYEDKSGVTKYSTKIAADTVQFLGGKAKETDNVVPIKTQKVTDPYSTPFDDMPSDLPF